MVNEPGARGGESPRVLPGMSVQRVPPFEAMQSQLIGTLEIERSTNCLVVRMGNTVVDVAWPLGWSVAIRNGDIALVDAAGQTVRRLGDEVWVGGGSVDADAANVISCTGRKEVFLASGFSGP
jgi:hypothetical protein